MDQNDIANQSVSESDKSLNISDVINAIRDTDPCATGIFNSGSASTAEVNSQQSPNTHTNTGRTTAMTGRSNHHSSRAPPSPYPNAYVKIIEQPAPKALRFRYECEGRSAGSIPGANSTPDNKAYPGIQVVNYRGRAVVVVSCVTKEKPYRAHPHKLVGKDICSKGVCTLEINNDNMTATFANLGIQCVKKKDIDDSLKEREKIRVDPFRKGFGHASQPSSIDLNAVRLCFQVFLKDPEGHNFNIPLEPVVSEPIFDKKAMSDLVICKLSKPSCTVDGGEEIILLCEKVSKEDIQVRFYEENQGVILWEGFGEFQHTNVHKQVAISFRTPQYKTIDISQPVKCFIQLRRPSDSATSDSLPFEYIPSGRRSLLELHKGLKVKGNFETLKRYLTPDGYIDPAKIANSIKTDLETDDSCVQRKKPCIDNYLKDQEPMAIEDMDVVDSTEKTSEWLEKTEFSIMNDELATVASITNTPQSNNTFDYDTAIASPLVSRIEDSQNLLAQSEVSCEDDEDKTLNELLEQVAELDDLYSGYQMKRNFKLEETKIGNGNDVSFDFDDTATYTSLQRAFKNPIQISDPDPQPRSFNVDYDAVEPIINPLAPMIDISSFKRIDNVVVEEEKLPPLPPKRLRKITAENTEYNANLLPPTPSPREQKNQTHDEPQIIIKRSPASSTNNSAQSSPQKKQGFFSRIFRRKSKSDIDSNCGTETKNSPNLSRESSFNTFEGFDRNRLSTRSCRMPQSPSKNSKPVGRSVSSVSGKRPHLTADVVHIPLKGLSSDSLPMRSGSGNIIMSEHYSSNFTLSNNLDRKTVSALQLADIPIQDGNMELVAIADAQSLRNLCEGQYGVKLDADVDLSEAEHFALYTSMAPHATQSEFDEMSAFYAPVEAAEVVPNSEIAKRLALSGQSKQ